MKGNMTTLNNEQKSLVEGLISEQTIHTLYQNFETKERVLTHFYFLDNHGKFVVASVKKPILQKKS